MVSISRIKRDRSNKVEPVDNNPGWLLPWLSICLPGITAVSFITLMLYYYCTMRFVEDFIPSLTLLAVLGLWQGYQLTAQAKVLRFLYGFSAISLATISIAVGILLGVSSYTERFRYMNPDLYNNIIRLFTR
jgi:hypothetical protein